ncbi:MAG: recombination-associated protein RdgC [Oligoflexales bacterium]
MLFLLSSEATLSLFQGALSFCRYQLTGGLPSDFADLDIRSHQSGRISLAQSTRLEKSGWVLPQLDHLVDITEDGFWGLRDCRISGGYVLRMRTERRQLSAHLLQQLIKEQLQHKESNGDTLNREARKEVREEVRENLLQRTLPTISYIDAYLTDTGRLYLFSTSKKAREQFETLFKATFCESTKISLHHMRPPFLGQYDLASAPHHESDRFIDALQNTIPSTFVGSQILLRSPSGADA